VIFWGSNVNILAIFCRPRRKRADLKAFKHSIKVEKLIAFLSEKKNYK